MADQTVRRPKGRLKNGASVYTVNDSLQIQNITCKTRTCSNQCWVAEMRKSDNKIGKQLNETLIENNNACHELESIMLKLNPNYLHVDNAKCHSMVTWKYHGKSVKHLTLLDSGSEATIVSLDFARKLGLDEVC